mgnify:CR=1 FL=1
MKYHIEKNTVQETLVIPLYARKKAAEIFPNLYEDKTAAKIIDQIDYDFSVVKKLRARRCTALDFWKSPCGKTTLR